jgi:tRNA-Thr(GGU) m(6)t(6)A37 methyltransferase TsaA
MLQPYVFSPIGYIESCFKERFGTPRQPGLVPSSWGRLQLRPELNLNDALEDLEGFSHLWLIFVFHQNMNKGVNAKVQPPRLEGGKTGLFATRTPHRPNPIGLSVVKLDRVAPGLLHFSGVDLVHGTPILDIKPYVPDADCILDSKAGWTKSRPERTLQVEFMPVAVSQLVQNFGPLATRAQAAIKELLELDPRPVFYRGSCENPNPYTDTYGFRFDDCNIVYRMDEKLATVLSVQSWIEYLGSNPCS